MSATSDSATTLTHRTFDVGDVKIHGVEAGDGPLVVLLHGFPEFWYSWRKQIPALAAAGFRVVAIDMRGYNLSSKPKAVAAYAMRNLVDDVAGVIRACGTTRAHVVGHDWGAGVAWAFAMAHPDFLDRLAILNGPHPRRLLAAFRTAAQLRKSWYMFFFQIPWLPETLLGLDGYRRMLRGIQKDAVTPDAFTDADLAEYARAFSQPGAMRCMIHYYRAMRLRKGQVRVRPIDRPVLVLWGEQDRYLGRELAAPEPRDVPHVQVEYIPDASHWVHHERPEQVSEQLVRFFRESGGSGRSADS
jgi:pimeloyl-ACP methyl ester carboxylesterase